MASHQENQREVGWRNRLYNILRLVFLAAAVGALLMTFQVTPSKYSPLFEGLFLVLAAALTMANHARRLPVENAIMAAIFIAVISSLVQIIGVKTGIPFGPLNYTENFGPKLFHLLPWSIPIIWVVFLLNSRGVAKLILRPWRTANYYGFWIMGLTCLLTVMLDFGLEPFATRINHLWSWKMINPILSWYDSPWVNFLGWGATSLLILVFTTLWLINKRVSQQDTFDYSPLVLWLTFNFFFAAINARHELLWAAGFGLLAGILVAAAALQGTRPR
jgi:uncharacterized membrane protein